MFLPSLNGQGTLNKLLHCFGKCEGFSWTICRVLSNPIYSLSPVYSLLSYRSTNQVHRQLSNLMKVMCRRNTGEKENKLNRETVCIDEVLTQIKKIRQQPQKEPKVRIRPWVISEPKNSRHFNQAENFKQGQKKSWLGKT